MRMISGLAAILVLSGCSFVQDPASASVLCGPAAEWRDKAEALQVVANTAPRDTSEGHREMSAAFAELANVTLPPSPEDPSEAALHEAMRELTDVAERWLSDSALMHGLMSEGSPASGEERIAAYQTQEESRLAWNAATRTVDSYLVDVCAIEPIESFKTE